jgi:hypothetical protein
MRMRIQKATNRLREHLLGDGQGNSMKISFHQHGHRKETRA